MTIVFYDMEDEANPLNGIAIHDTDRLRSILLSLQDRERFTCELDRANGSELVLGVGPIGFAEYSRDGDAPYLYAITNRTVIHGGYVEFLAGGTPTPVDARFCMPFDDVIKIAVYFMETGKASPRFAWEAL
jgi:Immunity protein Imm1